MNYDYHQILSTDSLLDNERLSVIFSGIIDKISHLNGEVWECGCYKGGTALFMKQLLDFTASNKTLRLFDTFSGIPFTGSKDTHLIGSFSADYNCVLDKFKTYSNYFIHQGIMPDTFLGLENSLISLAHIDVDNYDSVKSCLEFIYPRLETGGMIIIDDYNCASCPGAKLATDEFLETYKHSLVIAGLPSPQAHFFKK